MAETKVQGDQLVDIKDASIAGDAAISTSKLAEGAEFVQRDGSVALTGDLPAGGNKITGLADGSAASDAATFGQLTASMAGVDWKDSVRVVTGGALPANTRAGNVLTADVNGVLPSIDGVGLTVGDRVLVKDETPGANNGIYEVTDLGSGATPWELTRASDADMDAEVTTGLRTYAEEGSTNIGRQYTLNTLNPITVNTTALTFVQTNSLDKLDAGGGLTKSGNTVDVGAGDGIDVNANDIAVDVSDLVGAGIEDDGSNNFRIAAAAAGDGLQGGAGSALALDLLASGGLKIVTGEAAVEPADFAGFGLEDDGSDNLRIAAAAAGDGLQGGGGTALALDLKASGGLKIDTGEAAVEPADFAGAGLEDDGSDNLRISTGAAGDGITGGGGSALAVDFIRMETPSGVVNGINVTFTLANTPVSAMETVYRNGVALEEGAGNDYTISGATITFATAPPTGSKVRVSYFK